MVFIYIRSWTRNIPPNPIPFSMEGLVNNNLGHHHDDVNEPPAEAPAEAARHCRLSNLLPILALLCLTYSVLTSGYTARGDPSRLGFVLFSYADLLFLFYFLRRFERLAPGSSAEERTRLKAAVWLLSTALMLAFGYRVSETVPLALAGIVWILAAAVSAGGFYGLFLLKEEEDKRGR
ncbi:hypothetical protein Cni_G17795 [Canna indica]|uniref:Uncharacterized protein n=1 Tax=Canna indica TaxID=4628 RepID=A0AAQ3KI42_9LILI|nr:hypothetical protein Cni_G17795 [Canna indica]